MFDTDIVIFELLNKITDCRQQRYTHGYGCFDNFFVPRENQTASALARNHSFDKDAEVLKIKQIFCELFNFK